MKDINRDAILIILLFTMLFIILPLLAFPLYVAVQKYILWVAPSFKPIIGITSGFVTLSILAGLVLIIITIYYYIFGRDEKITTYSIKTPQDIERAKRGQK